MAKTKLLIPKVMVQAVLLSIVAILVTTVICFLVMVTTPNAVYHKILDWMLLNHFNPEIYYTDYYRRLSLIASEEDWMIVTPLSYLFGGAVFGYILSSRRDRPYVLKASLVTALLFTTMVLTLCYFSSDMLQAQSADQGVDYRARPYQSSQFIMVGVQAVYWSAVYIIGGLVGNLLKTPKSKSAVRLQSPTIAA